MKCVIIEFSYGKSVSAWLGYAAVHALRSKIVTSADKISKSADGGLAKPRGVQLTVAEFYKGALHPGYERGLC